MPLKGEGRFGLAPLIKFYCLLLIIVYFKMGLFNYISSDQFGKPTTSACDFLQYYTASIFARYGEAVHAYNGATLRSAGEVITGQKISRLAWNYPPTFLLIVYPLSFLSYPASLYLWLLVTLSGYLFVLYRIAPDRLTLWLAIVFPATFMNINHGQNGFLFASLLGGGLLLLNQHPIAAGILLGLLTCKPQFAILVPVALIAGRRWKALGSMAATMIAMIVISAVVFGREIWVAFFENAPFVRKLLETGSAPWFKMPTVFVAARMVGFDINVSYLLQAVVAMGMAIVVYYVWSQKRKEEVSNAILVLSILLTTPYAFVHDLTMFAIPIAYLSWQGYTKGWLPYEKIILTLVWHMPLFSMFIALFTPLQIGPFILLAHMIFTLWRMFRT